MKKTILHSAAAIVGLYTILSSITFAAASPETVTIVNHYPKTLYFAFYRDDNSLVPEMPLTFSLTSGEQIKSAVTVRPNNIADQVYIHVCNQPNDNPDHMCSGDTEAFWSISKQDGIHGYLTHNFSFKWDSSANPTITFCSNDDYSK